MKKLSVLLFLFSFFYTKGQSIDSVNTKYSEASDSAANFYFINQRETLAIHNGRVFYGYPGMVNHAFYPETDWQNGSLLYDGIWYHDISFKYDIYKDELVILHPNNTPVRLFSDRVQEFYFQGQNFVRLSQDKDNIIKSGFYQRLAEGNATIFARRYKEKQENIVELAIERRFVGFNDYYVLKDGNYHAIVKKRSLLNLLKDKKQGIVQHLSQKKLRYKDDVEKSILQIVEFYNQSYK
jgi:hypothetical protein